MIPLKKIQRFLAEEKKQSVNSISTELLEGLEYLLKMKEHKFIVNPNILKADFEKASRNYYYQRKPLTKEIFESELKNRCVHYFNVASVRLFNNDTACLEIQICNSQTNTPVFSRLTELSDAVYFFKNSLYIRTQFNKLDSLNNKIELAKNLGKIKTLSSAKILRNKFPFLDFEKNSEKVIQIKCTGLRILGDCNTAEPTLEFECELLIDNKHVETQILTDVYFKEIFN